MTQSALDGQLLARAKQPFEPVGGLRARAYGSELDEAHVLSGLRPGSAVAHGQAVELGAGALEQDGVSEPLRVRGHDLAFQAQALVHGPGQRATQAQGVGLLGGGQLAVQHSAGDRGTACYLLLHDGCEESGPETVPAVELKVL
ncbi:hypothetical protein ACRJ4W_09655 [Streptomyces sp. GLT-R25]